MKTNGPPFRAVNLLVAWIVTAVLGVLLVLVDVRGGRLRQLLGYVTGDPFKWLASIKGLLQHFPLFCTGVVFLPAIAFAGTQVIIRARRKYFASSKRGSVTAWWKQLSE